MCFLVEGVENKETCVVLGTWGCLLITYGEYTYHKQLSMQHQNPCATQLSNG